MPRKAIDYSKSCIYKICCRDPDITDFYIGSTTELTKRRYGHKQCCINPNQPAYNRPVYQYIRDNGGWDNWEVVKIENYDCNCSEDLCKRERELFEELKPTLNKNKPFISVVETKEFYKEYHKANKDKRSQQSKKRYEENKDKMKKYSKEYYEENKDKKKKYSKEYRENNKESITKKASQKITCECGAVISKSHKARHLETNKHKKLLAIINN